MGTPRSAETEIAVKIDVEEDRRSEKGSESDDHASLPKRCRLCAIPNNDMVDIFTSSDDTEGDILEMIRYCLRVVVTETDALPKQVCQVCLEELQLCYQFNQIVAEAESQLVALDRQTSGKLDGTDTNCQPSSGTVQPSATVHFGTENTPLSPKTQNTEPTTVKTGQATAETVRRNLDLTCLKRCSVVLVATETQPGSLCSKNDGRRSSSDSGNENADSSMDVAYSGKTSVSHPQSTSESGVSRMICSGLRTTNKKHLNTHRAKEIKDIVNPVIEHTRVDSRKRRYNCSVCAMTFSRTSHLTEHSRIHGRGRYDRQSCEKEFKRRSERDRHHHSHVNERPFKCSLCDKSFKRPDSLKVHAVNHPENVDSTVHRCSVCDKPFAYKSSMKTHMLSHTGEKRWQCDYCKKFFAIKAKLTGHMLSHTVEKRWQCDYCKKFVATKANLMRHMLSHTGEKRWQCDCCKKFVATKANLTRHMLSHTGEKRWQCDYCKKCFAFKSTLTRHMLSHTGEKRWQCDYCKKSFARKHHLQSHMLSHTGEKPWQCDYCKKFFSFKYHLRPHMLSHTGEKPWQCDYCKKFFSLKFNLKRHLSHCT